MSSPQQYLLSGTIGAVSARFAMGQRLFSAVGIGVISAGIENYAVDGTTPKLKDISAGGIAAFAERSSQAILKVSPISAPISTAVSPYVGAFASFIVGIIFKSKTQQQSSQNKK